MSAKAPPLIEISRTPPSKVLSVLKLFLNVNCVEVEVTLKDGVSRVLSVTQLGSLWKAELGAVSGVDASVTQMEPSAHVPVGVQLAAPLVKAVTQPAGRAGGITPSKFSIKA